MEEVNEKKKRGIGPKGVVIVVLLIILLFVALNERFHHQVYAIIHSHEHDM